MIVSVFGATDAIGSLTVSELLDRGHTVSAHVSDPTLIPDGWEGRVRVVVGDLSDARSVDNAVAGAGAVVSTLTPSLRPSASGLAPVTATDHIIASMHRYGVERYVGHATSAVRDQRDTVTARTRLVDAATRTTFSRNRRELLAMTALVTSSGLRWTIVRFTAATNGSRTDAPRVGFYGRDRIGLSVHRVDVAAFTAGQVTDDTYVGAAPAISS